MEMSRSARDVGRVWLSSTLIEHIPWMQENTSTQWHPIAQGFSLLASLREGFV
jgi:hypothetical protein